MNKNMDIDMDLRKIENEKRKLKRMEQVLRSKIWGEMAAEERGGGERKKQAEQRISELKNAYTEEKIFRNEESLSEYKIALTRAYGSDLEKPKLENLIYWHLTNYLTEQEKFVVLNHDTV